MVVTLTVKRRRKNRRREEVSNQVRVIEEEREWWEEAESGVRTTCSSDFTIVYRHRSTEWPVPYTDSHTPGAHEVIERVKELRSNRKKEGRRKKEREKEGRKGTKENTIDKDGTTVRGDLRTSKEDGDLHYRFPLDEFTPTITTNEQFVSPAFLSRLFV